VGARHLDDLHVLNAISATIPTTELTRLSADPEVRAVVPDTHLRVAAPETAVATAHHQGDARAAANTASTLPAGTCPPAGQSMLEPEALADTHTDSDDPSAPTARSLGFTGAGVKVGYVSDGIDVDNPDFRRADGSSVFAGYRDFSGEGIDAATDGSESFIDASAIAAQGLVTHNVQGFGSPALSAACNVRIEGIAPGVQLYAYKTRGISTHPALSAYVQAIDYAVTVDHVDVLNESVVLNPYPDSTTMNLINQANEAASCERLT
jgi:hypothetical protein